MSQQEHNTLQSIATHLVLAVEPLRRAVSDLSSFQILMRRLGWSVESLPPTYQNLATQVDSAVDALTALGDEPELDEVLDLIDHVEQVYHAIQTLTEVPAGVDGPAFLSEIGERLFELLIIDALSANLPTLYTICHMLGIIQREVHPATATRPLFVRNTFHFAEISETVSDPLSIVERF